MVDYIDRVRGTRRKKIENAIRQAGYERQYATKSYITRSRVNKIPELDVMKLAEAMGRKEKEQKRYFSQRLRNVNGIPLEFAEELIKFLKENHNINLNIQFSDYNS